MRPPSRGGSHLPEHVRYRDPLEATLATELSPEILMEHTRRIAADERESGTPGEACAFDYIATTPALVRESNRAVHALDEAAELVDEFLASKATSS